MAKSKPSENDIDKLKNYFAKMGISLTMFKAALITLRTPTRVKQNC